jgi:hypothetical protein
VPVGDERDVLYWHVVQALYGARCLHLNSCVVRLEMVRHKGNTQPRVDRAEEQRMSRIEPQCGQMRDMPLCVECVCAHTLKTFVGAEVGEEALQSKRRLLGVRRAMLPQSMSVARVMLHAVPHERKEVYARSCRALPALSRSRGSDAQP